MWGLSVQRVMVLWPDGLVIGGVTMVMQVCQT